MHEYFGEKIIISMHFLLLQGTIYVNIVSGQQQP